MMKKVHINSINSLKHGFAIDGKVSPEYYAWNAMKSRCGNQKNKKYHMYGGRGIKVCDEWLEFIPFLRYVGLRPTPNHSIDRIDGNKGYEPGNVRWATALEQNRNRCNARSVCFNGSKLSLVEVAEISGIRYSTLCKRWRCGYRNYESLTATVNMKKSKYSNKSASIVLGDI